MHHRKLTFWLIAAGVMLFVTGMLFLLPAQQASAQCGSQASSCKNCHETQGQKPVTNDGKAWHDANHTIIDACTLCHAGNSQATDKVAAHTGLVAPLSDVAASCKSCHPKDFQAKAQIFANTLGVQIGSSNVGNQTTAATPVAAVVVPVATQVAVVPAGDMVDYSQRYNEVALGQKPANVGNIIMIVLIIALVLGAGFFIARREGLLKVSFQDTKQIKGSYPADVVDMVPDLAKLKPAARKDLRQILSKPATAAELFALVIKLMKKEDPSTQNEKENV
jgi:hypothetical protein